MSTATLTIPDIGNVIFAQSSKARRMRITIRRDRSITVTVPRGGSIDEAKKFLMTKTRWLLKHLRRYERLEEMDCEPIDISSVNLEEAQRGLFRRLADFSRRYNLPYSRAVFRCQRTRWGSCSGRNNINLNINIAFLPSELQDYVLLHELVHTKVKNHGRKFWSELDRYTQGRAKELAKELAKNHRIRIGV